MVRALAWLAALSFAACGGKLEPSAAPPVCTVMSVGVSFDGGVSLTTDHVGDVDAAGVHLSFSQCGGPVLNDVSTDDGRWHCGDRAAAPDTWCCYETGVANGASLCDAVLSTR